MKIEKIPNELKKMKHWVGFKVEDGKKVPKNPKLMKLNCNAKINDSTTWGTFEEAVRMVECGLADGIGFAITKDTGFIFVDFDCHVDGVDDDDERRRIEQYYNSFSSQAPALD